MGNGDKDLNNRHTNKSSYSVRQNSNLIPHPQPNQRSVFVGGLNSDGRAAPDEGHQTIDADGRNNLKQKCMLTDLLVNMESLFT